MIDGIIALTDTFDIRDNFLKEQFLELSKVIRVLFTSPSSKPPARVTRRIKFVIVSASRL
jgi:hypothetical protein